MSTPIRSVGGALAVSAVLLLGAACGGPETRSASTEAVAESSSPPSPGAPSPSLRPEDAAPPVPAPAQAVKATTTRGQRPVRITVPSIGVDASMTDLGIAGDGAIEVPSDPAQVGWLDTTPAPGEQGPAVVAGHVDSTTGPAVFYELSTLRAGDEVTIEKQDGSSVRFTVDEVRLYAQDRFPSAAVYGPTPVPSLRLITCGGDYVKSRGGYQDNVVVFAS